MLAVSGETSVARPAISWPAVLAVGVFTLTLWAQGNVMVGVFYDDGIYVTAAKALAEGMGYHNIHLPGAPPIVHYPPLYPLMLSLLWRMWPSFPANVALFALFDAAALGLAAWVMALHLVPRLRQPEWLTVVMLGAGFACFPLLALIGVRLSEPLFLLLFAAAVAVADREAPRVVDGGLAGLLAGLCIEVKSVGICVLAGILLVLWLRGRRSASIAAAAAGVVVVAPWLAWLWLHVGKVDPRLANYTTYLSEAHQAGLTAVFGGFKGRALWPIPGIIVPPWATRWVRYPASAVVLAAFVWGVGRATRRAPALVMSLALYFLVVSLWPFPPYRFVWIVFPWVLVLMASGCLDAWRRGLWGRALVAVVIVSAALGLLPREALSLWQRRFLINNEGISRSFGALAPSIAAELPKDAVVASEDEALIFLYTGRRTFPSILFHWSGMGTDEFTLAQTLPLWCETGVTHLAVTAKADPTRKFVEQLQARSDTVLTRLFQLTDGPGLYRFRCPL
jgi:hypothetical protein